jgi:hypothetical protein
MCIKIELEVSGCKECPYYASSRYGYCKKKHKNDVEAYHSGFYAEYDSELKWMFENCPLRRHSLTTDVPDT